MSNEFRLYAVPRGCQETVIGSPQGAVRQYRCPDGMHVREYVDGSLAGHYDRVDPRKNLLGHLIHDAPVEGALLAAAGGVGAAALAKRPDLAIGLALFLGVGFLALSAYAAR